MSINKQAKAMSKNKTICSLVISNLIVISSLVNLPSVLAAAQKPTENIKQIYQVDNSVYSASFFDQYLPQNALEMIQRLPGFNFDQGSNARGFGGNAGNVLIDGKRPTSKSGGLAGALIRIPAAQVERIEILRGGISAAEASGQSIVANVIRKTEGSSGTWAAKLRRAPAGETLPNIEAAVNTSLGDWKSAFDIDIGGGPGYRTAVLETRDEFGQLEYTQDEILSDRGKWAFVNGEGSKKMADGLLTLNARLGGSQFSAEISRDRYDGRFPDNSAPDELWALDLKNTFKIAELGVDWARTQGDWKTHVLALALVNDVFFENELLVDELFDSHYENDSQKSEYISRATYGYVGSDKFKPEYGVEIAKNKLVKDSEFYVVINDIDFTHVVVEELRSEIFANFVYQTNKKLSVNGGITAEFSEIKVSGDSRNKQSFQFLKPQISATYKLDKETQLTMEAGRRVGQLNFHNFAASNNTEDGVSFSGNPNLAPDKTDEFSINYDWSFSERGSLKVKVFHQWKSDVLEQINLPSGGQGLGNAGNARFWGVQADVNFPLDLILENGLLEIAYGYRDSSFNDPIIDGERTINGYNPKYLNFNLRQDITEMKLAWGVEYWGHFKDAYYRVNEIQNFSGNDRFRVFIETSRYLGVKIQLEVTHLNTGDYTRSRYFYQDDRGGEFIGSEVARRHRRPELKLSFFGSF